MNRRQLIAGVGDGALFLLGCFLAGCAPKSRDTLHPQYANFRVKRIGTIVWCAAYVPGDLAYTSVPAVRYSMRMVRADSWDTFLSPSIRREIHATLRSKGYEVIDLEDNEVRFGTDTGLRTTLATVAEKHKDLDAILAVAYCVSPLHLEVLDSRSSANCTYITYRGDTDGINLKGRLKLFHLPSLTMLWELGDHATYYYRSAELSETARLSRAERAGPVCRRFGSAFGAPSGAIRGFPACPERQ